MSFQVLYSAFIEVDNGRGRFTVEFVATEGFCVNGCVLGLERPPSYPPVNYRFGVVGFFDMAPRSSRGGRGRGAGSRGGRSA